MMKIKFDQDVLKTMSMFELVTRVNAKDCFEIEDRWYFIVPTGFIGKALGKGASNIKKLEGMLKKKVRVIEYSSDLDQFVRNVVNPLKLSEVVIDGNVVTMTAVDHKTRGLLIGRGAQHLRTFETIVKRYFDVEEMKVN